MANQTFYGAFSMSSSQRGNWLAFDKEIPGINKYDKEVIQNNNAPKHGFTKQKRAKIIDYYRLSKEKRPNPGEYIIYDPNSETKKTKFGPGYGKEVPKDKQFELSSTKNNLVGPGSYDVRNQAPQYQSLPSYSFGQRFLNKLFYIPDTPGPGQYEQDEAKKDNDQLTQQENKSVKSSTKDFYNINLRNTASSFGQSTREKYYNKNKNPGPGEYEQLHINQVQSPEFSIGKQVRDLNKKEEELPGVGQYDLDTKIQNLKRGFSIGGKYTNLYEERKNRQMPGPGQHNPALVETRANVKFTQGERYEHNESIKSNLPGPGSYKPEMSQTIGQFKFGLSSRQDLSKSNCPGVGSYEVRMFPERGTDTPKYGIGGGNDQSERPTFKMADPLKPGPGAYDPKMALTKTKSPMYGTQTSQRVDFAKSSEKTPGPGNYKIDRALSQGPKYSFGTYDKQKKLLSQIDFRPLCYDIPSSIGYIPKYLQNKKDKQLYEQKTSIFKFQNY